MYLSIGLFNFFGFLIAFHGVAESCDPTIEAASGAGELGYRWRGDRCEGLFQKKIGADGLLLCGFLIQDPPMVEPGDVLLLSVPHSSVEASIRAVPLIRGFAYQMDVNLGEQETFLWQTGEVFSSTGLQFDQIGLFGWYEEGRDFVYVPVLLQDRSERVNVNPRIRLMVRPVELISNVKWRLLNNDGTRSQSLPGWQSVSRSGEPSSQSFEIMFPPLPHNRYQIQIRADSEGSRFPARLDITVEL